MAAIITGLLLAAVYFFIATQVTGKILHSQIRGKIFLLLGSYLLRLIIILSVVLYVHYYSPIDIKYMLVSLLAGFTLLLIIEIIKYTREGKWNKERIN